MEDWKTELEAVVYERLSKEGEKVITDSTTKKFYKSTMRKAFSLLDPEAMEHFHRVVDYLLNLPKINYLKQKMSKENYEKMIAYINLGREYYYRSTQLREQLEKATSQEKKKEYEKQMMFLCYKAPLTATTLITIFVGLVTIADLSNIAPEITTPDTESRRRQRFGDDVFTN